MSAAPRRSNRPFWTLIGILGVASVVFVVLIFVNRPIVIRGQEAIARANLLRVRDAALRISEEVGTLDAAEPRALAELLPDLLFIDPDQSSNEPEIISVFAVDGVWAAAAGPTTGGCQWIRIDASGSDVRGIGTDCSGEGAATAPAAWWPDPQSA